ncbi:MAG: hypothetical protein AW07_04755 [Candidatus Accumulibacter sp. SK-11]|nr:MAG: hypothetical protein AW07_04755 [Candidatus Accumulibacter sp. SK-11]
MRRRAVVSGNRQVVGQGKWIRVHQAAPSCPLLIDDANMSAPGAAASGETASAATPQSARSTRATDQSRQDNALSPARGGVPDWSAAGPLSQGIATPFPLPCAQCHRTTGSRARGLRRWLTARWEPRQRPSTAAAGTGASLFPMAGLLAGSHAYRERAVCSMRPVAVLVRYGGICFCRPVLLSALLPASAMSSGGLNLNPKCRGSSPITAAERM